MKLTVRSQDEPLWLCFEPWANEYTVPPQTGVVIEFDVEQGGVELMHHADGITFFSLGRHPDVWGEDGEALLILSTVMPPTPDGLSDPDAVFKQVMQAVPPIRSSPASE
jgi:hypothetical protein